MVRRHIAALLSALALLQLPVVTGGAACADRLAIGGIADRGHAAAAAHGSSHLDQQLAVEASPSGAGESGQGGAPADGENHSCAAGGDAPCCGSGASCSATAALPEQARWAPDPVAVDRALAASTEAPLSFRPTLEPPPPRG